QGGESGMTLLELVLACGILLILAGAALPLVRRQVRYQRENELRADLLLMREAIDRYKDASDKRLIQVDAGGAGYPKDLDLLVNGVNLTTGDKKVHFLREIPADPMTHQKNWGLRCSSDEPDSQSWCGKNVFDVYSNSHDTGTDGRLYSEW